MSRQAYPNPYFPLVLPRPTVAPSARRNGLLDAGMQYLNFIVIPGDEETLRLLAEQVLPAVA